MLTTIMRYSDPFLRLRKSKFRRSRQLGYIERQMVEELGMDGIRHHAEMIIEKKLQNPYVDGKQTPYQGHPVFIAMHATATCCRNCLFRWHRIPRHRPLTEEEKRFVVGLIMVWIKKEIRTKCVKSNLYSYVYKSL